MPIVRSLFAATLIGSLLAGCANKPPEPEWEMNAQGSSQKALDAYLSGNARVDKLEWERARAEVARTARPDLLARLELLRCAAQVASLAVEPCSAFEALRQDAAAPERAYADYLAGKPLAAPDVALLPAAQRAVAAPGSGGAALAAIEDPLSRLVAAGVLLQAGRADPAAIATATDTASAQGWRRPLMAWLLLQVQRAEAAGDKDAAERLRRRVAVVEQAGGSK
ncbi:hypothetical protein ASE28_05360 [Acidovorax sp. Root219]|nr:hypothetical protein ASE28_05360 [Acidovorax sp. Root219]